MKTYSTVPIQCVASVLALGAAHIASAQEPFSETRVLVEINATDGDIGFHALLDADAWHKVTIDDPSGTGLFRAKAKGSLADQGLTENFFESDEPLCSPELVEEEGELVVTLAEFQERFPAGEYIFTGTSNEGETLTDTATLTYDLPAAPDIEAFDGTGNVPTDNAEITWAEGDDLGECPFGDLVPPPGSVPEVGWEVVVEPEDEEAVFPLRVFSVQLPPDRTSVTVPQEFLDAYVAQGVTVFKFEVGAIEASGNQTFSEGVFCTTECPED
ncbi:MAG TPA: hypothetical protein VFG91_03585 [Woeseiaceae bacterium]|nr:hypothetical protein [Woeseiaceae bacterium]